MHSVPFCAFASIVLRLHFYHTALRWLEKEIFFPLSSCVSVKTRVTRDCRITLDQTPSEPLDKQKSSLENSNKNYCDPVT